MENQRLPLRVFAATLPLAVIALVFGAVGYATKTPETTQIPPLPEAPVAIPAARGEITGLEGGRVTLVTETGASLDYALAPEVTVEALESITPAAIQIGDWINGGAIPHPQTLLALERLVLLPEPVTP